MNTCGHFNASFRFFPEIIIWNACYVMYTYTFSWKTAKFIFKKTTFLLNQQNEWYVEWNSYFDIYIFYEYGIQFRRFH